LRLASPDGLALAQCSGEVIPFSYPSLWAGRTFNVRPFGISDPLMLEVPVAEGQIEKIWCNRAKLCRSTLGSGEN
jgi:hypothetical protein